MITHVIFCSNVETMNSKCNFSYNLRTYITNTFHTYYKPSKYHLKALFSTHHKFVNVIKCIFVIIRGCVVASFTNPGKHYYFSY